MDRRVFLQRGLGAVVGLAVGFGFGSGAAWARGASSEESARARRIFGQGGAVRKGEPVSSASGVFTVEPGDGLTFECTGYCLDGNLAVPSDDEPLAFRPMKNYIAPELRPLYVAMMRRVGSGPKTDVHVQQIVYAIRSAAFEHSSLLNARDYAFVNSLVPGGERLLKTARRSSPYIFEPGLSLWASKSMPPETQSYSMLREDGVAGQGLGISNLSMRGTIVNGSPSPFVFDPTQWVLESSRDVQAVALPVTRAVFAARGVTPVAPRKDPAANERSSATPAPSKTPSSGSGKKEPEYIGY